MGAEEGTRDMTWEEIEEGADKSRVKGGKTAQIAARAGALVSGAPCDDSGQPTKKAALGWMFMGAEKGTIGMTWQEIEEVAAVLRGEGGSKCKTAASRKRKREGGLKGNDANKVACLARGQDDSHSHACILCTQVRNVLHSFNHREGMEEGYPMLPPRVPGRPKNDIWLQRALVSQLSPNSHTVQGDGVHLYRLLTITAIL